MNPEVPNCYRRDITCRNLHSERDLFSQLARSFRSLSQMGLRFRQPDFNEQAGRRVVLCANRSAVGSNHAFSDGKAEAGAARQPVAGIRHPVERAKNIDKLGLWKAWAIVTNCDADEGFPGLTHNFDQHLDRGRCLQS